MTIALASNTEREREREYIITQTNEMSIVPNIARLIPYSFSRLYEGNLRNFYSASNNTKFSAERNVVDCQLWGYFSRDVQTNQASLSPKRDILCHQTGKLQV